MDESSGVAKRDSLGDVGCEGSRPGPVRGGTRTTFSNGQTIRNLSRRFSRMLRSSWHGTMVDLMGGDRHAPRVVLVALYHYYYYPTMKGGFGAGGSGVERDHIARHQQTPHLLNMIIMARRHREALGKEMSPLRVFDCSTTKATAYVIYGYFVPYVVRIHTYRVYIKVVRISPPKRTLNSRADEQDPPLHFPPFDIVRRSRSHRWGSRRRRPVIFSRAEVRSTTGLVCTGRVWATRLP